MTKFGLFYGTSSGATRAVAEKIRQTLGPDQVTLYDVASASPAALADHEFLILGVPTYGHGVLQPDWITFLDQVGENAFDGKRVAVFGLGDQRAYADSFADALIDLFKKAVDGGAVARGAWSVEGYDFYKSRAASGGMFAGLVLDENNQPDLTDERIKAWCASLE